MGGEHCRRRIQVGSTITYKATPEGHDHEIHVEGSRPGWHTVTAGWTPYWAGGDFPTSMGWHPNYDIPIGPVRVTQGTPVYGVCDGTLEVVGVGTSTTGIGHRWTGCPSCGWTQRERLPEPVTEPLFEDAP